MSSVIGQSVDINEHDTVETPSPAPPERANPPYGGPLSRSRFARRLGWGLALLAVLGAVAAAVLAFHPRRRQLLSLGGPSLATLRVASKPEGADVFIDDKPCGTTPTSAEILAGPHAVRIVRRGYKPWRGEVDTTEARELAPALEPLELATLIVESQPDRASVFLDEEYRGTTPLWINNVEAGSHTVRITKEPLYQPVTEPVERLRKDETRRLSVRLPSGLEAYYLGRIKAQPNKLGNYSDLIRHHVNRGEAAKAIPIIPQALAALKAGEVQATEVRQFHDELAALHKALAGTLDKATRDQIVNAVLFLFEKLLAAKPSDPDLYAPLVNFLINEAKRSADIARICDQVSEGSKNRGAVHLQVAQLCFRWDPQTAMSLLERTVALQPKAFEPHFQLGSGYQRTDRPDDALREYQAAEKFVAEASAYQRGTLYSSMARLLGAKGDTAGAVARYQEALKVEISPYYSSQWRLLFAQFLEEKNRKGEAIQQYKEILRLGPDYAAGREARRALQRLGEK